jgi:hypothetical protein
MIAASKRGEMKMFKLIYRINGAKFQRTFDTMEALQRYETILVENKVEIIGRKGG